MLAICVARARVGFDLISLSVTASSLAPGNAHLNSNTPLYRLKMVNGSQEKVFGPFEQ